MKYTALNQVHKNLGAKMVPFAGYEMPVQYTGVKEEHFVVRENVGLFDVSHMGQFLFKGKYAEQLLQKLTTNDVTKLAIGKAQYNCLPNEKGGIIDDLIIYQLADEEYLMVVNASNIEKDWNWISSQNTEGVEMINQSDEISLIAVQGPKAVELVQKLTNTDASAIPFYHFSIGNIGAVENVIISGTGYTGSGGFELYFPNQYAEQIWNDLLEAGKDLGVLPCGLAARDTLRLEKGYCLYGNDTNDATTPLEAGLGWITKFGTGFTAEDIIQKQKETGVTKKLIGFKMIERGIPRHDYLIKDSAGNEIGIVTSGTQSPSLNEGIGLGYVTTQFSSINDKIYIEIREKLIEAQVVKLPFVN